MQNKDDLFDFLGRLSQQTKLDEATAFLQDFIAKWGLTNVAYAALNVPGVAEVRPLISTTYTTEWQRRYAQQGYVDIDPIVRAGLGGIMPVDWATVDRGSKIVTRFFAEAQELNVGSQGISIPIRGRHNEFAMFTITSDLKLAEWKSLSREIARDMMLIAYRFHDTALQSLGIDTQRDKQLSPREAACLRWKAHGKSDSEIADILGVAVSTIRFHLENARTRLDAMNTTHAVALAIRAGLINSYYEPSEQLKGEVPPISTS